MPYYVVLKGAGDSFDREASPVFESSAEARVYLTTLDDRAGDYTIAFVPTQDQMWAFTDRENARFDSGEYLPIPWRAYAHKYPYHFAHMSIARPGLIAYTKTLEHGINDRQTIVKPGRYLTEYYADTFDHARITEYAAQCSAAHMALQFATRADDIQTVYENGPRSCMSHDASDYSSPCHPVRVYADCDLAVAYCGPIDGAYARAVVWPNKKHYQRIYGAVEMMRALLHDAGYTRGSLDGARIRRITITGRKHCYVMPYVDGIAGAEEYDREFLILSDDGAISVSNTDGISGVDRRECDHCGNDYIYDEYNGNPDYCDDCADRMWACDECGEAYFDDDSANNTPRGVFCDDCYSATARTCDDCEADFNDRDFSWRDDRDRRARGVAGYCDDCADHYAHCDCGALVRDDADHDCPARACEAAS